MKKLSISLFSLVALCLCLCLSSFALSYAIFEVRDNTFQTGNISIDLNGGRPIIQASDFLFEPGMTVEKPLYIQNNSSWAVYYKLYFAEVSGVLGDILEVTVIDEDGTEVLNGKLSSLTEGNVAVLENELEVGQRRNLTVRFHYPEEEGNRGQGTGLTFELAAVAVQTKNNPNKEF